MSSVLPDVFSWGPRVVSALSALGGFAFLMSVLTEGSDPEPATMGALLVVNVVGVVVAERLALPLPRWLAAAGFLLPAAAQAAAWVTP